MKRITVLLAALLLLAWATTAPAQDPRSAQDELISLVGEAIVQETTQRSEEVRKARDVLDVILRRGGTRTEREEAERDLERAEGRYADSQKKLDHARLEAYADRCGKSPSEIQAMRDSGMGWGRIAKECGIHPSAAGKGNKGKGKSKNKSKGKGKKK
ncbi:hypothetical protein GM415_10685 [Pseudodesulfovibrio cashew]|uniref:Uncharacterized protein n=1 Tax=Pseudodesulfovibrio cashew TaxID=2678688 RepID=A0A6I6JHR5_9BACT|nr:hypothetical protein [Pseudodesulfovibrio cashew]QGY40570.1 hypothetical protein GM415_10685 [Pseudodesulfovibrio cashew]